MDQYNRRTNGGNLPYAWYPRAYANFYPIFRPTTLRQPFQTVTPEETVTEDCNSSSPEPQKIKDNELFAPNPTTSKPKRRKKNPESKATEPVQAPASRRPTVPYIIIAILSALLIAGVIVVPIVVTHLIKNLQSNKDAPNTAPTASTASLSGSATVYNLYYDGSLTDNNSPLAVLYNKIFCQDGVIPTIRIALPGNALSCSVQSYSKGSVNIAFTVIATVKPGEDIVSLQSTMKRSLESNLFNNNSVGLQFTYHAFIGAFNDSGSDAITQKPATVAQSVQDTSRLQTTAITGNTPNPISNQPVSVSDTITQKPATVAQTVVQSVQDTSKPQTTAIADNTPNSLSNQPVSVSDTITEKPATVAQTVAQSGQDTSKPQTTAIADNTPNSLSNQPATTVGTKSQTLIDVTETQTVERQTAVTETQTTPPTGGLRSVQSASLAGSFRVTSLNYTDALSDPSSEMFKQYEQLVCDNLKSIANTSALVSSIYRDCLVNKFLNGSLIAVFEVSLRDDSNDLVNGAAKIFKDFLTNISSNSPLVVDPSSVVIVPYVPQYNTTTASYRSAATQQPNGVPTNDVVTAPRGQPAVTGNTATNPAASTQQRVPSAATTILGVSPTVTTQQRNPPGVTTILGVSPAVTTQQRVVTTNPSGYPTFPPGGNPTSVPGGYPTIPPATSGPLSSRFASAYTTFISTNNGRSSTQYYPVYNSTTAPSIGCGQTSTLSRGRVSSPNYPYSYPAYYDCYYYVSLPYPSTISIVFDSLFQLESGYDYVYIYASSCGYGIYQYSGSTPPSPLYFYSCSSFYFGFHSDGSVQMSGFSLTYTATDPFQCGADLFTCWRGNQCVSNCTRCDGRCDCYSDCSDENNCPTVCRVDQFACWNGYQCIPICKQCDSINDCYDGSDEHNCTSACLPPRYQCSNINYNYGTRRCLAPCSLCDGVNDCGDWSDEYNCTCSSSQFRCRNGQCVLKSARCNGYTQCDDGSDEMACPCPYPDDFACTSGGCIRGSWRCDGYPDCGDSSDEHNCSGLCPFKQFKCASNGWCLLTKSQCFPYPASYYYKYDNCANDTFVCDGYSDCVDGSDERNCTNVPRNNYYTSTTAPPYTINGNCSSRVGGYQCANGECLQVAAYDSYHTSCYASNNYCQKCGWNFKCDGYRDCLDGSDEGNCTGLVTGNDNSTCSPGQFRCNNSICINCQYVCNGYSECGDNSDERDCPCASGQFRCNNGQCVYSGYRCDGYFSCNDGSDEFNCTCSYNQFRCNNGQCVSSYDRCDGYTECYDGSDEFNCTCQYYQFRCANGQCISSSYRCDGYKDCFDGSDERNCSCASYQWQCNSGQCIYSSYRCDGNFDCSDRSDELNCPCSSYQFRCNNGQCIYASYQCNGYTNCIDGSDESNCTCTDMQFKCDHYYCLSSCKRCDGVVDCPYDSSDEDNCTCDNSTHYRCPSSRKCIPRCKVCDGSYDCVIYSPSYIYDYADENYCPTVCKVNQFRCQSGNQCVQACHQCDGIPQCSDYSDEFNCSCAFNETHCDTHGQCFRNSSRCDGTLDCADGTDEIGCACQSNQFRCQNGQCVSSWARCYNNGYYFCVDKSDQFNCSCSSSYEFSCSTHGQCVQSYSVCDGYQNCADGSDEIGCVNCTRLEFRCPGSRTCLNISKWCDGRYDCNGSSDENYYNCGGYYGSYSCPSGFRPCSYYSNQGCYPYDGRCDGVLDCANGYDETSCSCPSDTKFTCNNGVCLSKSKWCDGRRDCTDGSDEPAHCSRKCGLNSMECLNGRCVSNSLLCNGINNCGDYTDETNCTCSPYYQFNCTNGMCMDSSRWCDGVEDCPDGGDEAPGCATRCNPGVFTCNNSRCVDRYNLCNGWNDCGDNSDEINCVCGSNQYQCEMGVCVTLSTWCDGYRDCPDGSDEPPDCHSRCARGEVKCVVTGECIVPAQVCDHIRDCPDNSDEINCPCLSYQYRCTNGSCIYREWLCDGVKDCPLGDDETPSNCDHCNPITQFRCASDYHCISIGQQCDGVADCVDSSDEVNCLKINASVSTPSNSSTLVRATYHGVSDFYICASQWSFNWSDLACKLMGFQAVSYSGNSSVVATHFLGAIVPIANLTNTTFVMANLAPVSCPSNLAVTLSCRNMECGVRSVPPDSVGPYIVNGDVAARGAWPWQIQLYVYGSFNCGGSIINQWWILTAAHCVAGGYSASAFTVKVGSTSLSGGNESQTLNVAQVFSNPWYDSSRISYDNALLRLQTPIQFSDTAKPICMPSPSINLRQFRVCVASGFGRHRFGSQYPVSPIMLQAKMNLMSYEACVANALNVTGPNGNSYVAYDIDYRVMICAGSPPTKNDINTCNGDSGGPLVCQDQHGIWTQIGVVSWGFYDTYRIACQNSVFARLPALMDFVQNTMAAYSNF